MATLVNRTLRISVNGSELAISTSVAERSNEWIVALHGIQSNKALFDGLFGQNFADHYSLLAIDFPGFGDSDKPGDFSYEVVDQAGVVRQILDKLRVERMHLVGHSLGGMVGTLLLGELGDRVMSFANLEGNLVLADCGASAEATQMTLEEFEARGYKNMLAGIEKSREPSAAARSRWVRHVPAKVFYLTSVSIVEWSRSEKLRDLFNASEVRRLFMYGSQNAIKADALAARVEKVEIPDTGHFMLLDNPSACYEALRRFITAR